MPVFPNERPIPTHELISLAEDGAFSDFDEGIIDSGTLPAQSTTRKDYNFTMAGPNGHIVVARPISGTVNPWAKDINNPEWLENASYDTRTGGLDPSTCPQPAPAPVPAGAPGTCGSCGNAPALVGGGVPAFCPSCGAAIAPATTGAIQVGPTPGLPLPPIIGGKTLVGAFNPNRMEGRPQKEVIVPEGMKACAKPTGFTDALDALLAEAETPDSALEFVSGLGTSEQA